MIFHAVGLNAIERSAMVSEYLEKSTSEKRSVVAGGMAQAVEGKLRARCVED